MVGMLGWTLLYAVALFQVFTTLPLYLRDGYGFRESAIGFLLAFNATIIVLFEMLLIHWAEERDRFALIGIGGLLTCVGLGLLPFGGSVAFAAFTVVVWTIGEMLTLPLLGVLVASRSTPASRGRYMGAYTLAFSFAFIVAPAAGTWILEWLGPLPLWSGIAAIGPLLVLGALGIRRLVAHGRAGDPLARHNDAARSGADRGTNPRRSRCASRWTRR